MQNLQKKSLAKFLIKNYHGKTKNYLLIGIFISLSLAGCAKHEITNAPHVIEINSKMATGIDKTTDSINQHTLSIIFSHNIAGELESCGCGKFPLGGFPQAYGLFNNLKLKENKSIVYIDSGDAFFSSTFIPPTLQEKQKQIAKTIVGAFNILNLNLFTPGEQDFSAGLDFFANNAKNLQAKILISNLDKNFIKSKNAFFPSIDWSLIKANGFNIIIMAIVLPDTFTNLPDIQPLFTDPIAAIQKTINDVKKNGFDPKDPNSRLILVSHSGRDYDELIAKRYPEINWIIGSHSQSFLQQAIHINGVQIGQVLAKNNYIGEIVIKNDSNNKSKKNDEYKLHDVYMTLNQEVNPNIMQEYIDNER